MPLKNSWLFPVIEAIHLIGMAAFVGTVVASVKTRWTNLGLALLLVTGPILFAADPTRYLTNPAFRIKMIVFALALIAHFKFRRFTIVLLVLWTCVIVAARAIADFDL